MTVIDLTWQPENQATWIMDHTHPDALGWSNQNPTPRDRATIRRWTQHGMETDRTLMYSLSPLGIVVRGNTAVAHYYASWSMEGQGGERTTTNSRCTDTLVRENGRWLYLGWFCFDEPTDGG